MFKKRAIRVLLFTFGVVFLVGLGWLLGGANEWDLWKMSRSLGALQHPAGTQFIASSNAVGLLAGNGNHCDFFVGELRGYDSAQVSQGQLRAFYAHCSLWNPKRQRWQKVSLATIEGKKLHFLSSEDEWTGMAEFLSDHFGADWPRKPNHPPRYVLFIFDVGHEAGCDLRCT